MEPILSNLVAGLVASAIEELREATREAIAAKIREVADRIERGDVVPDEALERARERQARINDIRDKLPEG